MKDGGPAFPQPTQPGHYSTGGSGMSLRDYFAIHAPEPSPDAIRLVMQMEQQANPHNDSYKPTRHGEQEIKAMLRYKYADELLKARSEDGE